MHRIIASISMLFGNKDNALKAELEHSRHVFRHIVDQL